MLKPGSNSFSFDKALFNLILLFCFTAPLSQFINVRVLFITFILFFFVGKLGAKTRRTFKQGWDIVLYLLVIAIGLIHTEKIDFGLSVLESSFSLLAMPFLFSSLYPFKETELQKMLCSFIVGLLIACVICLANAIISYFQSGYPGSFFFYHFTDVIDFQPTYFAYYLCFAISVILYFIHFKNEKYPVYILGGLAMFFFMILMLTAGKTAYVSMLLVFSFYILKFLFAETRSLSTSITFGISIFLLLCMLLFNYFDVNAIFDNSNENSDYWERLPLWKAAIDANPNFLFGVGTGDYKVVLNDYFRTHGLEQYAKSSLNSHNQFVQIFFSNGLIGLFSLILLLGRPLYISVKHQNILGIMVFFSFFVYGMTEVFLGRYQGVAFFAFLHQCFVSYYFNQDSPNP